MSSSPRWVVSLMWILPAVNKGRHSVRCVNTASSWLNEIAVGVLESYLLYEAVVRSNKELWSGIGGLKQTHCSVIRDEEIPWEILKVHFKSMQLDWRVRTRSCGFHARGDADRFPKQTVPWHFSSYNPCYHWTWKMPYNYAIATSQGFCGTLFPHFYNHQTTELENEILHRLSIGCTH